MRRLLVPLLAAVFVLAACAQAPRGGSGNSDGFAAPPATQENFDARADQVAAAWRGSPAQKAWGTGFVPMGEFTIVTGFATGEAKMAFNDGLFTSKAALPETASTGSVRFPDGSELKVDVVSAWSAYQTLDRGDPTCATCGLTVTAAKLGTANLLTSRGDAVVPAWIFTVAEDPAPIVRVAVAPSSVTPLPEFSLPNMPAGLVQPMGDVTANGTTISYKVGVGSCDTGISGLVKEYDDVIVIGGTAIAPTSGVCDAALRAKPVSVTLTKPVGQRMVLGISGGAIKV